MAEKNRKKHSRPGIPDALHPDIGNGALWENQSHAFLLRSPDPSKELDALLNDPDTRAKAIEAWKLEHTLNGEETISHAGVVGEKEQSTTTEISDQSADQINKAHNQPDESSSVTLPLEQDTVSPESTEVSPVDMDKPAGDADSLEPVIQKATKAGKRVRKAVKSVSKQEAKSKKGPAAEPAPTESGSILSPFTKWLKGLSGSDYVHPYDDDFALIQSSGPGKEGISETFAELLAAQGYKDRAVEMYLKLMEKYPEKSGFFAAKIEALQ